MLHTVQWQTLQYGMIIGAGILRADMAATSLVKIVILLVSISTANGKMRSRLMLRHGDPIEIPVTQTIDGWNTLFIP